MKFSLRWPCALLVMTGLLLTPVALGQPPNIVHIFADDLGYGSVGFNGQTKIETPNLDALAAGGLVFDNAYAATVCGPSRAMLMSGFHNGHTRVDRNSNLGNAAGKGFAADEVMVSQVLKEAGYKTAAMGKWGFGGTNGRNIGSGTPDPIPSVADPASLPTNHGFDEFFGYLNHNRAHDYLIDHLWQDDAGEASGVGLFDNRVGGVAAYSADTIHQRAGQFIGDNAGGAEPFYMQMNYTIPHFDIDAIDQAPAVTDNSGQPIAGTAGRGMYAGDPTMSDNAEQYAAMVTRMDTYIGLLVERLDDPNSDGDNSDSVLDNTLILFTSDNGATTEDGSPVGFFEANGDFRGGKRDLYEGGVRVPTVAYWPDKIGTGAGKVAPGVNTRRIDLADFLPTAAELAGTYGPVGMDGVSIASLLTGESDRVQRSRESLLFEHFEGGGLDPDSRSPRWAIIKDDKKLIRYSNGSTDLFDLATDPTEQNNIAGGQSALVAELEALAVAEGAGQADSFAVAYRSWTGGDGDDAGADANWSGSGAPAAHWSAVLANTSAADQTAFVATDVTTLGFEIRGASAAARQTVVVEEGQSLTGRNEVRISAHGAIEIQGGTLASNRWVDVLDEGQLRGHGDVDADVYNFGQVDISGDQSDTGVLSVSGDYFQLAGGELSFEIGGSIGGDQFDQLAIGQTATLGGTLNVSFTGGFEPQEGDFFPLLNAGEVVGQFDLENLPAPPAGVTLSLQYTSNLVLLVAGDFQLLDGDINLDGMLDQLDVNDFIAGWLHQQPVPDRNSYVMGDLNLDGTTDRSDWRLLRQAFLDAGLQAPRFVAVPEPSALALLALGGAAVLLLRRRSSIALLIVFACAAPLANGATLLVDRDTGNLTLSNTTGQSVEVLAYDILSSAGGLDESAWISIAGNYDAATNGGNGSVDLNDEWFRFTATGSRTDLAEGSFGEATFAIGQTIDLGNGWVPSPFEDLVATLALTDGTDLVVDVVYSGTLVTSPIVLGDFNADGTINAADWPALRGNLFSDVSHLLAVDANAAGDIDGNGRVDEFDFEQFKTAFDAANGAGAFATMITPVPEPTTFSLAILGLFLLRSRSIQSILRIS